MSTNRVLGLAATLGAVLAVSVAWAASTPVTSQKLTVDAPKVCSVGAAADAFVDEAASSTNNGTGTTLAVKSLLLGNRRTLVRFDLTSCSIPGTATVVSAALKLYLSSAPTLSRTHEVYRVTSAWTETGVTWASQPSTALAATSTASTGTTSGTVIEWDVKADVAAFVSGAATNQGWLVKDLLEGDALGAEAVFSSREHATAGQRPVLVVTYR